MVLVINETFTVLPSDVPQKKTKKNSLHSLGFTLVSEYQKKKKKKRTLRLNMNVKLIVVEENPNLLFIASPGIAEML